MELKQYASILLRWTWLIVLCALIASLLAYVVSRQQTPIYAASTVLLVNSPARGIAQYSDSALRSTEGMLGTYAELLVKRPVLEETIKDLNLSRSPESLKQQIAVTVTPNTLLLVLTVEDTDPQRAADIANQLVRVLNRQEQELLANPYAAYREALQVIEVALPRSAPVRPLVMTNVLMALAVGIVLAIGVALLAEHFNDTARSIDDVQRVLGLPTLATVTRISGERPSDKLVTAKAPRSPVAEVYRMLLAHIEFATLQRPTRSILVTSAEPGEGKSTTVANLATALAQNGKQVILVDADLRVPTLHKFFGCPNQTGVTTVLLQDSWNNLDDYLLPTGIENLRLMPSGTLSANPPKLINSPRMIELIDQLARRSDIVLFDSPSALSVVDATLLARACDATLLVVRADSTRTEAVRRARDLVVQSGTYMLGVVLNRVASRSPRYYDGREQQTGLRSWVGRMFGSRSKDTNRPVGASGGDSPSE